MSWAYEGNEGYVATRKRANHESLRRYYNWKDGRHAYLIGDMKKPKGFSYDGIAGYLARRKPSGNTHKRLYWLIHPAGDNVFTTRKGEATALKKAGYKSQDIALYVARKMSSGHQPFYRAHDPAVGDHLYSYDVEVIDLNGPTLTMDELEALLRKHLKKLFWPRNYSINLGDGVYYCPRQDVAEKVMRESGVSDLIYTSEILDCDDFAHLLKSAFIRNVYDSGERSLPYAMGIIRGNSPAHAMNFIAISDGGEPELKLVEPQRYEYMKIAEETLSDIYLMVG
jgi:hypothetical protein